MSWNEEIVLAKYHKSWETGWETCRSESRREASNAKSRKSIFHFKPEKVNRFEYCDNLWKQNIFITQWGNGKRVFKIICMQCVLCVCKSSCKFTRGNKSQPKHKTVIEDLDKIMQDFKTVRLGQNRYTALTSLNVDVQTRLWFISAAVASVKFQTLCCSCSGATFGLFFPCL